MEPSLALSLAQAFSNRAPRGRKHDFRDAERLVRRLGAGELTLSFVPEPPQRLWRTMTRAKVQLTEDKSRLQSQVECLLEEMRIKLSSLLSDLLGVSGYRMLRALAGGETDAKKLAALADERLPCSEEQLIEALSGNSQPTHRRLLSLYLNRHPMLVEQIAELDRLIAEALKPHQEAVARLALAPGLGVDSAQQIIAEVGVDAGTFPSAAHLSAWVGTCPGRDESAEENPSSRSAKGNKYLRRVLNQAAHAAVKKKGSHFQAVFHRLLPRLGYKAAIWAVAHRLCRLVWKMLHEAIPYIERGSEPDARTQRRRARQLVRSLRKLGYQVDLRAVKPTPATA